jgi:hypothetical protein
LEIDNSETPKTLARAVWFGARLEIDNSETQRAQSY